MGRPKIVLTEEQWQQIDKMCSIFCTGEEIAYVLGVSYDTLERRVKERFNISCADYIKNKSSLGKMSLRRWQMDSAKKGNATMQIWLGKQYLGQKEPKLETEHTDKQVYVNVFENENPIRKNTKTS